MTTVLTVMLQRLLTGEMCCYDVAAAEDWKHGQDHWLKKCCDNPTGNPVLRPSKPLSVSQRKKVSTEQISVKLFSLPSLGDCDCDCGCTQTPLLLNSKLYFISSDVGFRRGI